MIAEMREKLQSWDVRAFRGVARVEGRGRLRVFWRACSRAADGPLYVAAALTAALAGGHSHQVLTAFAVAFALDLALYTVLKRTFRRKRPFQALPDVVRWIVPPDEFSFPSGHTAGACLMAVLGCAFFPAAGPALVGFAVLVGYSRVALAVHYPGDVLAGALLGSSCACLGLACVGLL